MNQTLNSSRNPEQALSGSQVDALHVVYLAASSLAMFTSVCGAAGNGAVVWLLSVGVQRTPFCVYMLNLAVADLLFLLCMASVLTLETPSLADSHTKVHEVVRRVMYFAYTASLSLLTAISVQRCLSVLFPLWYKCRRPRHLSTVVCSLLWALALLMNTLTTLFCLRFWRHDEGRCFMVDTAMGTLIMGVFTPAMTVSGITLYVRVRRSALLWRRRPRRLLVVILASILVFLVGSPLQLLPAHPGWPAAGAPKLCSPPCWGHVPIWQQETGPLPCWVGPHQSAESSKGHSCHEGSESPGRELERLGTEEAGAAQA
uniref:MAS related GPR family member D n=1 Tax=Spermophilus dauricus TaxID=99837 RepID=A0A8C9PB91_SPEDA